MSNDKGIFEPQEGFASPPKSPFSVDESAENPFATPDDGNKSPFAVAGDDTPTRLNPDAAEPFASGDAKSPFGFEPPAAGGSPFGIDEPAKTPAPEKTDSPFGVAPAEPEKSATPFAQVAETPASTPAVSPNPVVSDDDSDSSSIKQLELRAIFGVDRELNESEILQRSGSLPGIRHLSRVAAGDVAAVEGIKRVIPSLGFGGGQVKLYCGSTPIDFIKEGSVMLAVQTDGGFGPGVRETLMIAARELGRM